MAVVDMTPAPTTPEEEPPLLRVKEEELPPTRMTGANAKAKPKAIPPLIVPKRLVDQVNAGRPRCIFYPRPKGCIKGAKCPQRHVGDLENEHRMPNMSFAHTKDGLLKCTMRPPIDEFFEAVFSNENTPRRVLRPHHPKHIFIIHNKQVERLPKLVQHGWGVNDTFVGKT